MGRVDCLCSHQFCPKRIRSRVDSVERTRLKWSFVLFVLCFGSICLMSLNLERRTTWERSYGHSNHHSWIHRLTPCRIIEYIIQHLASRQPPWTTSLAHSEHVSSFQGLHFEHSRGVVGWLFTSTCWLDHRISTNSRPNEAVQRIYGRHFLTSCDRKHQLVSESTLQPILAFEVFCWNT